MKTSLFFLTTLLFVCVSCTSKESNVKVDTTDIAEAMYVVSGEFNRASFKGVNYLIYVNAENQNFVSDSTASSTVYSHIFYKHKYHFMIVKRMDVPLLLLEHMEKSELVNDPETAYLKYMLNEINGCLSDMFKNEKAEVDFWYDNFRVNIKITSDTKIELNIVPYSSEGEEIIGEYKEDVRLRKKLVENEKKILLLKDSVSLLEEKIVKNKTILENAKLYSQYIKQKWEYDKNKNLVFTTYDRRPYDKIRKIVQEHPEIISEKAQYEKNNLQKLQQEMIQAEENKSFLVRELDSIQVLYSKYLQQLNDF